MEKSPFRHPSEMPTHEQREPISARVPKSVKKTLEEVARENGLSLGELIGNILEDYVKWLDEK
jgi:predicted HicB family RNase H-like nuclease